MRFDTWKPLAPAQFPQTHQVPLALGDLTPLRIPNPQHRYTRHFFVTNLSILSSDHSERSDISLRTDGLE
jgi:hypothetical protein